MIFITFQKEGIHCYPDAAFSTELESVKFLGSPHRHIFHFRVEIEVFHQDRDIEFIMFKRWCEALYGPKLDLNYKSCEMIADELSLLITEKYPGRDLRIEVSEDGENGCIHFYPTPTKE